jgi:hypothetical protein
MQIQYLLSLAAASLMLTASFVDSTDMPVLPYRTVCSGTKAPKNKTCKPNLTCLNTNNKTGHGICAYSQPARGQLCGNKNSPARLDCKSDGDDCVLTNPSSGDYKCAPTKKILALGQQCGGPGSPLGLACRRIYTCLKLNSETGYGVCAKRYPGYDELCGNVNSTVRLPCKHQAYVTCKQTDFVTGNFTCYTRPKNDYKQ